jgi:septal ring factor EnvC (AmiA/AmiB activator)
LEKKEDIGIEKVVHVVNIADDKLPSLEALYGQVKDLVDNIQHTRQYLSNDIQAMRNKISILDATAFSSEQECRRKEQQVQELIEQNEGLEKLMWKE